jgi:hypothetical protein
LYWGGARIPKGMDVLGVVEREIGDAGALFRTKAGVYVQGNAGCIRMLPQRDVVEALRTANRARSASRSEPGKIGEWGSYVEG